MSSAIVASKNSSAPTKDLSKLSKKQIKRVTTKKERLAIKEAKKQTLLKTRTEREAEVQDTKAQLGKWNLDEKFDAIRTLFAQLDLFVETGNSVAGRILFPEAPPQPMGRVIVYSFVNRRGNKGTCDLLVRDGQEYFASEKRRRNQNVPSTPLPSSSSYSSSSLGVSADSSISPLALQGADDPFSAPAESSSGNTFEQELMSILKPDRSVTETESTSSSLDSATKQPTIEVLQ